MAYHDVNKQSHPFHCLKLSIWRYLFEVIQIRLNESILRCTRTSRICALFSFYLHSFHSLYILLMVERWEKKYNFTLMIVYSFSILIECNAIFNGVQWLVFAEYRLWTSQAYYHFIWVCGELANQTRHLIFLHKILQWIKCHPWCHRNVIDRMHIFLDKQSVRYFPFDLNKKNVLFWF